MYYISYCIDLDIFYVEQPSKDYGSYYTFYEPFDDEKSAIKFFTKHIFEFVAIRNQLRTDAGQKVSNTIYLENTKSFYRLEHKTPKIEDIHEIF